MGPSGIPDAGGGVGTKAGRAGEGETCSLRARRRARVVTAGVATPPGSLSYWTARNFSGTRPALGRGVDDDGHEKHDAVGHVMAAVDGEAPFAAEVAVAARLGLRRDDRQEIGALADLAADFLVPRVAAAEFVFVIPDVDPGGFEGVAEEAGGGAILGGVVYENRGPREDGRKVGVGGVAGHVGCKARRPPPGRQARG